MATDNQVTFLFEGDTSDLEKALGRVVRAQKKANKESEDGNKKSEAAFGGVVEKVKGMNKGLLGAAAAAAVVAVGAVKGAQAVMDFAAAADAVAKSAKAIGTTAEELQVVTGGFGLMGIGANESEMAIKKLGLRIGQVAAGAGGPAADAFAKLGVSAAELEALPLEERMAKIADGVAAMGSQAERTTVLNGIFEESGIQLAGAFSEGGDAVRAAAEKIRAAGVISNESAARAEELSDAAALAGRSFASLKRDAIEPFVPVFTAVIKGFSRFADELRETGAIEQFSKALSNTLAVLGPVALTVTAQFIKAFVRIKPALQSAVVGFKAVQAAVAFFSGDAKKSYLANKALSDSMDELTKAAGGMNAELDAIDEKTVEALAAMDEQFRKVGKTVKEVKEEVGELGSSGGDVEFDPTPFAEGAKAAVEALEDLRAAQLAGLERVDEQEALALGRAKGRRDEDKKAAEGHAGALADVETEYQAAKTLIEETAEAEREELRKEQAEAQKELALGAIDEVANTTNAVLGSLEGMFNQQGDMRAEAAKGIGDEIIEIDKKIEASSSETEKKRLKATKDRLEKEKADEEAAAVKAYQVGKALAITQAAISTALSVITAIAQFPGPVGIALGIAAGITGAATIATIAAEPPPSFAAGAAPDEIVARLHRGEGVLNAQGVRAAGGNEAVQQLNRGQPTGGEQVIVFKVNNRVVDAMVSSNLRTKRGSLSEAFRAVQPRSIGRHSPYAKSGS